MKIFRINLFLKLKDFLISIIKILIFKTNHSQIKNILKKNSKKKYAELTSQCRVGLIHILDFFKKTKPHKTEIIFSSYNLPAMINIAKQLKFKVVFSPIIMKDGSFDLKKLKKRINKKTLALVQTNMFNSPKNSIDIKKICKKNKIILIEDNAIYFDNYFKNRTGKVFSGSFGDFTIYSFNIMKNISALYGGAITFNSRKFKLFYDKNMNYYNSFPIFLIFKQILIYLILKIVSLKYVYNLIFFNFVKIAHNKNNQILMNLFYPSLRFKITSLPKYYYSKINILSKELIFKQLVNIRARNENHSLRKKKNLYYLKKLKQINLKEIKHFQIRDVNYQNFIDFPVMVEKKKKLIKYLLKNGIEVKAVHYQDCSRLFTIKPKCKISEIFERKIICLPNHKKVNFDYIDRVLSNIKNFYSTN